MRREVRNEDEEEKRGMKGGKERGVLLQKIDKRCGGVMWRHKLIIFLIMEQPEAFYSSYMTGIFQHYQYFLVIREQ